MYVFVKCPKFSLVLFACGGAKRAAGKVEHVIDKE